MNFENVLNEVINLLNRQYLSNEIEVLSISEDKKSVKLSTNFKKDPWGNKYQLDIYTYDDDDEESIPGLIVIYSKGIDGISSVNTYKDGNYGDDVISVVEPK